MEAIEITALHADKGASDLLIGVVTPGSGIGGRTTKDADGYEISNVPPVIAAVDGAQTRRPGKKQAADTNGVGGVGAVVDKPDVISAIDEVGERLIAGAWQGGCADVVIAAPIAIEIPIGAADVGHVGVNHHAQLGGIHSRFVEVTVTEAKAGAHDAEWGFREVWIFNFSRAKFLIDRIAGSEGDHDGIVVGFACILREMTIFDAIRCEEGQLPDLQFRIGGDHVADRGRISDGNQIQFRNVRIAAKAYTFIDHAIGWRIDDGELHPFLEIRIFASIDVERTFGDVLYVKNRGLLVLRGVGGRLSL